MESVEETRFLGNNAVRSLQSEIGHGESSSQVLLFFSLDDNLVLGFQDGDKGTQQLAVSNLNRTHSVLHKLDQEKENDSYCRTHDIGCCSHKEEHDDDGWNRCE